MSEELIGRLRKATTRHYRDSLTGGAITCPRAIERYDPGKLGMCHEVINGHVCELKNPHPSGWVHQCYCKKYGEDLG